MKAPLLACLFSICGFAVVTLLGLPLSEALTLGCFVVDVMILLHLERNRAP